MLPRSNVFVNERRVARAQHNQIEVRIGDQLTWRMTAQTSGRLEFLTGKFGKHTLVNNPDSQAYRFRKDGNDIYSQVDFIIKERNGTVELFADLVIQVTNLDAISFARIFIAVVIADVPELVAWLDVEDIWQTFRKNGRERDGG